MGRAILQIRAEGLSKHRELVLDSCVHNRAFDRPAEGSRAGYVFPIIHQSEEAQWFRDGIIDALPTVHDRFDASQLFEFAVLFAQQRDAEARQAAYDNFHHNDTGEAFTGAEELIRLDGIDGLIAVLEFIGSGPADMSWLQEGDYLVRQAEELDGIEQVRLALQDASSKPGVAEFLAGIDSVYSPYNSALEIRAIREEQLDKRVNSGRVPDDALWWEIKNHPEFCRVAYSWGWRTSDAELIHAATDLPLENDIERLRAHLSIFSKRPFPLDPDPLIELVSNADESVVARALNALEQVAHEKVRKLSFELRDSEEWSDRSVGLLKHNYRSGDHRMIVELLERETDPDKLHVMGLGVREVYEQNPSAEGLEPLMLVYEKGPCSMCRFGCVKLLRDLNGVPDWMAEECLHDADPETRQLAADMLESPEPTARTEGV